MKIIHKIMVFLLFGSFCGNNLASDPVATISPGDIVAADVLSERLDDAAKTKSKASIEDLVGVWETSQSVCIGGSASLEGNGLCDAGLVFEGSLEDGKLFLSRQDKWTIAKDSDTRITI